MGRRCAAVMAALLLSGCGSDDAGESRASTNLIAASPSPSPSPSATSTAYDKASDFNRDRRFIGYDRFNASALDGKFTTAEVTSSDTAETTYAVQGGRITLADSGDLPHGGSFAYASDSKQVLAAQMGFITADGTVLLGNDKQLVHYRYLTTASFKSKSQWQLLLIGAPTNVAELSGTGSRDYAVLINEQYTTGHVPPGTLSVDLSKNVVSGRVPLLYREDKANYCNVSGTLDAMRHITLTLQNDDGSITGAGRGRLFGPNGGEIGLVIDLRFKDDIHEAALLTGSSK